MLNRLKLVCFIIYAMFSVVISLAYCLAGMFSSFQEPATIGTYLFFGNIVFMIIVYIVFGDKIKQWLGGL